MYGATCHCRFEGGASVDIELNARGKAMHAVRLTGNQKLDGAYLRSVSRKSKLARRMEVLK